MLIECPCTSGAAYLPSDQVGSELWECVERRLADLCHLCKASHLINHSTNTVRFQGCEPYKTELLSTSFTS